jgi:hypothetical protein
VVDKLRKLGAWIWLVKERMILVVMVAFLVYRVYQVVYPPPMEEGPVVRPPKAKLPDDAAERNELVQQATLPPPPPPRELLAVPGNYAIVHRNNALWYYSAQQGSTDQGEITAAGLGLYLLDIQRVGTRLRARLQTGSTTRWYNEGEKFEAFELLRVDPEQGTVEVYAEQYGRQLTVQLQR